MDNTRRGDNEKLYVTVQGSYADLATRYEPGMAAADCIIKQVRLD
jgi:hypothetical protein